MDIHSANNRGYSYVTVDDFPDEVEDRKVYIAGDKGREWLAVFRCPCGCGDIIQLNLLKEARPRWRIRYLKKRRLTITPSISRLVNCRSHFTLVNGQIRWWGDDKYNL